MKTESYVMLTIFFHQSDLTLSNPPEADELFGSWIVLPKDGGDR